jgi:hypothetical protein
MTPLTVGGAQSIESATAWFVSLDNECDVALKVLAACGGDPSKAQEIHPDAARFTCVPSSLLDIFFG